MIAGHIYDDGYFGKDGLGGFQKEFIDRNGLNMLNIKEESAIDFMARTAETN